jgi:hypothetical protein
MTTRTPQSLAELSPEARRLAHLIPGVYLARNERVDGRPLFSLLEVLAAPLAELEAAIEQLHDDHFVERASAEALPLIAELVGARLLGNVTQTNRGIVARTLHWRRRKGTLRTLEEVLTFTSGWSAEVDEAFRSLLQTQDLANLIPWRGRTAVLWDPIALADPLSRRAPHAERQRGGGVQRELLLERQADESVEDVLRRLGRADAGRYAASPRTIDFTGWARPEQVVIRTSRFVPVELDQVEIGSVRQVTHRDDANVRFIGFHLEPQGRDLPLVGQMPLTRPDATGGLTARHEPAVASEPPQFYYGMLTPTTLAADGDAVEAADNLSVYVDGVPVIGPRLTAMTTGALAFAPLGPRLLLRFADIDRPSPADEWDVQLVAIDNEDSIQDNVATEAGTINPTLEAENPAVVWTVIRKGARDPEGTGAATQVPRRGATVAVRLARRNLQVGYRRDPTGNWSTFAIGVRRGEPLSPVVLLEQAGETVLARFERRPAGDLGIATWRPNGPDIGWELHAVDLTGLAASDLPDFSAAKSGPALGAVERSEALLLVAPLADGNALGVWQVDGATGTAPVAQRLDQPGPRQPGPRLAPALCLHDGALFVYGGERHGDILGDLWSMPLSGTDAGRWRPHRVRHRQARVGARLLSTPQGLVLLGGASTFGTLDTSVWRVDLSRSRPQWEALPALPMQSGYPGVLWARAAGDTLQALIWANRVWPHPARWTDGNTQWEVDPAERLNAPNPPAEGDVLFVGDEVLVVGPPPLPPSEVVFSMAGEGYIAFLPALDLARSADVGLFFVQRDGSTRRWFPPGVPAQGSLRLGAGRDAPTDGRQASQPRLGVPARLAWQPFRLRQRSLGPWESPLALALEEIVALDPRLGRVLLPSQIAQGRLSASFRIGRSAALGAGFMPPRRSIDERWREPVDPVQPQRFSVRTPPDLDADRLGGPAPVTARIIPAQAGTVQDGVPIVATLAQGVRPGIGVHVLEVYGSPRLARSQLVIGQPQVLSLATNATGSCPHLTAEDGVSLVLHERLEEDADPDQGPTFFLAGLSLEGSLEVGLSAGEVDLRWCTLATPGSIGVHVAGAGHQSPLVRHSLPAVRLILRLYGCLVGGLEVPPWVQVVAAGCTFDAGSPDAVALAAAGARLRLRHCTVHGRTLAGLLEASSCAFKGQLVCDRPDLSWARYSLLPEGGRPPLLYQSVLHAISFASLRPTEPHYLVLDDNNGAAARSAGERRCVPGAHAESTQRLLELTTRAEDYLPMTLVPYHVDRTTLDIFRMHRRPL